MFFFFRSVCSIQPVGRGGGSHCLDWCWRGISFVVLQQQKTGKTADLVLLALFGGVTAEGEGFGMAGRESQRFSLCVLMASVAILELLAHLVWKAKGVTNNKSTNCTALNSMTNTARWEVLRALQVSFHLAPHHGGFRRCGACSPAERGPAGWPSAWQSCTETWAATTLKPS